MLSILLGASCPTKEVEEREEWRDFGDVSWGGGNIRERRYGDSFVRGGKGAREAEEVEGEDETEAVDMGSTTGFAVEAVFGPGFSNQVLSSDGVLEERSGGTIDLGSGPDVFEDEEG